MSARSRQLQGSMGSSWDDGGYSPDEDVSVHTASDSDLDLGSSDKEMVQEDTDKATPLLSRSTRASSTQQYETPTKTPNRATARHSQTGSSRGTPRSTKSSRSTPGSAEPSFIMPGSSRKGSLNRQMEEYNNTPTRNSELRQRMSRQPHSPRVGRGTSKASQPSEQQEELGPWHYANLFYEHVALPLLTYVWDIVGYANRHFLKPILGVVLGVGVLFFGIQMASGMVYSKFTTALAPVCMLPGSSYLFSMCESTSSEHHAAFEDLVNVQSRFEDVLDSSKDTSNLPSTLKDSELAIRDLRILVKHSSLPSRHQLDLEFHNFVLTANEASVDLSRYNTRIGAAMDRVIGTNTWTMAVLQGLEEQEAATGSISRVLNAVTGAFVSPPPTLQQRIFEQFVVLVGQNKEEITKLIEIATALLSVLQNLDERLDTIYSLAINDDYTIGKNQDELLSSLWTKLGGNSASVKANAKQLNLLKNISGYRKKALKHVSETLLKLQEIQAELENLRDGVAAPEVLGWRGGLPVTYHVDQIEKGVDRLRLARGEHQRVEGETYRNRIKGAEMPEGGPLEIGTSKNTPVITVRAR